MDCLGDAGAAPLPPGVGATIRGQIEPAEGNADWLTDPANGVPRLYVVTVRGRVGPETKRSTLRQCSSESRPPRESHLVVELREGKNREVRRLFRSLGHEAARLKRVRFGGLELGSLALGEWRTIDEAELHRAFPEYRSARTRKV